MPRTCRPLAALLAGLFLSAATAAAADTVYLSSLDLSKAHQGWGQPAANKSVDGHPLTIGGQKFENGFGTHAVGTLIVDLKGGSSRFQAMVGLDDETAPNTGSAEFKLIADGKPLWQSGILKTGQAPKPVDVDVTGVQKLLLLVTDAGDGFNFDHADWADARFQVTGEKPETFARPVIDPVIAQPATPATPLITAPADFGVFAGTPVLMAVTANGQEPLAFSAPDLPAGLQLDAATGLVTGTLPKGDYPVTLTVKNSAGSASKKIRIVSGDRIALTPPLGWNSYDCFGDNVKEDEVRANAKFIAEKLKPHGWQYVVIDFRWYDPGAFNNNPNSRAGAQLAMDEFGRLIPPPNRFPSAADGKGFKPLADDLHAMGLKFGIHIMRGIPRQAVKANTPIANSTFKAADAGDPKNVCFWNPDMNGVRGDTPAGQAYYDSLLALYASWGVDFIKVDDLSQPYATAEIQAIRKAIDKCGRSIVFSTSPGETPVQQAEHVKTQANMWRISGDFWDNWHDLSYAFDLAHRWEGHGGPGHWPDSDMLPLGHLSVKNRSVGGDRRSSFTKPEQVMLLSLWCLQPSPLMLGGHLPDTDPFTLALLTNDEVLALQMDPLAKPATRTEQIEGGGEIWTRPLADGSTALGLFNRGEFELKLRPFKSPTPPATVRDLWAQKDLGPAQESTEFTLQPHSVLLLKLKPAQ